MGNKEHLEILKKGVKVWNEWRRMNPSVRPDLSEEDLFGEHLLGVDLSGTDLFEASLGNADLGNADLREADISGADLKRADLGEADLREAKISGANLFEAFLMGANLNKASILMTNFNNTYLRYTNFEKSEFGFTTVSNCDLSNTLKLASVIHIAPSTIGIDTIFKSKGKIPISFLKKCGIPKDVIETILPLAKGRKYHTCFISYSSKDEEFAEKLKKDLEKSDIQCWFFPEDAIPGKYVFENINEAIGRYDKILIICSKNSLNSKPVLREIERGLQKEKTKRRKKTEGVLFPINIDSYLLEKWDHFLKPDLINITIEDFTRWKNLREYKKAFNKLIKGLQK